MTKEEELRKQLEELQQALAEKNKEAQEAQSLLAEAMRQNEALVIAGQASTTGTYAELYTEEGIEYIITHPMIFDAETKTKMRTHAFLAKNKGMVKRLLEKKSEVIKLKGGDNGN